MSLTASEIMDLGGQNLPFSRDLREALAIYARRTWPLNTSVHAAKAWGVPKSTAANLLKGHASDATVTRIIRAGGWGLALPVIGAVIGEPIHTFLREQTRKATREAAVAIEHERLATAAWGRLAAADGGAGPVAAEDRAIAGTLGAQKARRLD